ncbi:MAG: hypothetical protein CMA63_02515 [Euryarchaeota archaeon]|nr:hypothetical protein [Euryarchaeota archaeon]|tara:strand:+ start:1923 stop:2213 length:291 start_codon:yes stop_codon:yes gene_type:complete
MRDSAMEIDLQDRLLRIENKLDSLTEKLSELGRIDERTDAAHARLTRHETRLDWIEKEHRELAEQVQKQAGSSQVWERAAWVIFAAALGLAGHFLR